MVVRLSYTFKMKRAFRSFKKDTTSCLNYKASLTSSIYRWTKLALVSWAAVAKSSCLLWETWRQWLICRKLCWLESTSISLPSELCEKSKKLPKSLLWICNLSKPIMLTRWARLWSRRHNKKSDMCCSELETSARSTRFATGPLVWLRHLFPSLMS